MVQPQDARERAPVAGPVFLVRAHLWSAVRYVERNPVRAGLVDRAEQYPWSSAAAHCGLRQAALLSKIAMPWPVANWLAYLLEEDEADVARIRQRTRTGRPCGATGFVEHLEATLGRVLHPRKRGPKPKKETRHTS